MKGLREHGRWSIHCGTQSSSSCPRLQGSREQQLEQAHRWSRATDDQTDRKSQWSYQGKPGSNRDPEPSGCRDRSCCHTNTGYRTPYRQSNSQRWRKPWYISQQCWKCYRRSKWPRYGRFHQCSSLRRSCCQRTQYRLLSPKSSCRQGQGMDRPRWLECEGNRNRMPSHRHHRSCP